MTSFCDDAEGRSTLGKIADVKRKGSCYTKRRVMHARVALGLVAGLVLSLAFGDLHHAEAMGDADRLDFALLALGSQPGAEEQSALERVAWELEKRTSVTAAPRPVVVTATDEKLRRHPLLAVHGRGSFAPLDERSLDALRGHLEAGGLLFIDGAEAERPLDDDPFDHDVRLLVRRLFPRAALAPIDPSHVLYKTFYLVAAPLGRRARSGTLEGVTIDGRLAIIYSRNDLLGALARDRLGAFAHAVEPGGEVQRERALRTMLNIVMYALCLDYKGDQVHTDFLIKTGRGGRR